MESGISFIDILVNEITMVVGALIFLLSGALLLFRRKSLSGPHKTLAAVALIITAIYLAFIIYLVLMWG